MEWTKLTTFDRTLSLAKSGDLMMIYNDKKLSREIAAIMLSARRFNITDDAAVRIRDAMANYPEYLSDNGQFAIPPFKTMWIEFNSRIMLKHDLLTSYMRDDADERVGYLIHNNRVYTFSENKNWIPGKTDYDFILNKPMSYETQKLLCELFGVSRIGIDPFLWGHTMYDYLTTEVRKDLRNQHGLELSKQVLKVYEENPEALKKIFREAYYSSAGELRNILAVLLMINQPSTSLRFSEVPRKRGMVKGRPMPYFGYSNVDINIDKSVHFNPNRKPNEGERKILRWHEVRGHFCHNAKAKEKTHVHIWRETEPHRWECALECGAKRWWREYPDGRGSAEKGYIHQSRRIRTKNDQSRSI